jgi:hypothetical protein
MILRQTPLVPNRFLMARMLTRMYHPPVIPRRPTTGLLIPDEEILDNLDYL